MCLNDEHRPARPLTVLVVDDDRDTADSTSDLMRLWGHRALVAYDGPSALALYDAFRPGVVLLDVDMPKVDGCEVARRLRRDYPQDGALIVAVSGWGRVEDCRRCTEAGVDRFLIKPTDPDELHRLLQRAAGVPPPGR
jgi:CheY-like chemotaxis protein